MIGSSRFGGQQQEDEVDRLIVERVKINSTVQARKQSEQPDQVRQFSMRDGNPIADRGAAELLRCMRISNIARSFCPVSNAARAASSCSTCFLLLTLSAGRIAFGAIRSVSGMDGT